jgi:hypothetical protein
MTAPERFADAPQPVMAGFQNAAAILLFLVQLGNIFGLDYNVPFTQLAFHADSIKPLSVLIAAITFYCYVERSQAARARSAHHHRDYRRHRPLLSVPDGGSRRTSG